MSDAAAARPSCAGGGGAPLLVSLREIRIVVERMLQVMAVDPGLRPALHDAIVATELAGLGGLARLASEDPRLARAPCPPHSLPPPLPACSELVVDCQDQSLLLVAAGLLDLCREHLVEAGELTVLATGVDDVELAAALVLLAERAGLRAVSLAWRGADGSVMAHRDAPSLPPGSGPPVSGPPGVGPPGSLPPVSGPAGLAQPGSLLLTVRRGGGRCRRGRGGSPANDAATGQPIGGAGAPAGPRGRAALADGAPYAAALRSGVPVSPQLWWALWERSQLALATESPASMRHAGPVIVDALGTVHGEPFEEL